MKLRAKQSGLRNLFYLKLQALFTQNLSSQRRIQRKAKYMKTVQLMRHEFALESQKAVAMLLLLKKTHGYPQLITESQKNLKTKQRRARTMKKKARRKKTKQTMKEKLMCYLLSSKNEIIATKPQKKLNSYCLMSKQN